MAEKKRYKDNPRYNAIYGYENDFKQSFANIFTVAIKDVNKKMIKLTK